MKKILVLLILVLLVETDQETVAQNLPAPDQADQASNDYTGNPNDTPPQFELPPMPKIDGSAGDTEILPVPEEDAEGRSLGLDAGDLQSSQESLTSDDQDYHLLDYEPAVLESSGTWLRRGFWYSELDAVILNRKFSRNSFFLMQQQTLGAFPLNNTLAIFGSRPGAETAPRLKLGRFLFRDQFNRDHTAEFILYGGGQWSQDARLDVNPNTGGANFLLVPQVLDGGNASFSGATSSQFNYQSRFNSFELNYHVKARMQRDRMELEPSGHWVRRAQPSISRSFLAGVRFFDLTENLGWNASGIPDANGDNQTETGNYRVHTDNDLIGTQLGFSWNYETSRWSLGASAKGGAFLNRVSLASDFLVTGGVTSGSIRDHEDNLSFLSEASLHGKWHLRPNLSLRAGLEMLYLTQTALAPNQLNFIPSGTSKVASASGSIYLGVSIGFEGYW